MYKNTDIIHKNNVDEHNLKEKNTIKLKIHESIKNKLDYFIETNKIPNIIFYGASGSGKKTIVGDFIKKMYDNDKEIISTYVIYENCAQGKGIKFIRENILFFAKRNINHTSNIEPTNEKTTTKYIKTIILLNADKLTNDAQSALRRCIEIFSKSTRFFIVVEDKCKLLKPILSRFCDIHVCLSILGTNQKKTSDLKFQQLNKYFIDQMYGSASTKQESNRIYTLKIVLLELYNKSDITTNASNLIVVCNELYEKGYSALDVMYIIENNNKFNELVHILPDKKYDLLTFFYKIKKEIRNESLLIYYILHFVFYDIPIPYDISFI